MPSNKEILEAQRYNRRRLVTAFASGTPGGRELESKSPFVPLTVGTILVVVMVVVAAVMSRFDPQLPSDWGDSTLITVKGTGARYYTIDERLRPVTNITSARLLAEAGEYKTSEVASAKLDGIARGSRVGLVDVPDDVPATDRLRPDQWFSCGLPGVPHTWVAELPEQRTARESALVTHDGLTYLVSGGRRHIIPPGDTNAVVLALGLDASSTAEVNGTWLSLFEPATELKAFSLPGAGSPVEGMPEAFGDALLGTLIEVEDSESTPFHVVTGPGQVTPLSRTAAKLYEAPTRLKATSDQFADLEILWQNKVEPLDWPESVANTVPEGSVPCAQLVAGEDGADGVALHSLPLDDVLSAAPGRRSQATQPTATVAGGSGALVRAVSPGGELGAVVLVSDLGRSHGLGSENPADVLARLGYAEDDVRDLPAAWLALIPPGTELSPDAAWGTVGQE